MSGFDGSGNYVRPYNWTNDAGNGLPISSSRFDTDGNTVAGAFNLCLTRDGQGKPTTAMSWSQALTLSPSTGVALTVNGTGGSYAQKITGVSSSNASYGLLINAGTSGTDAPLVITNAAGSVNLMQVFGDGHFNIGYNGAAYTISGSSTGAVSISAPMGANALTVNAVAGHVALSLLSPASAGASYGMGILAGTNSTDYSLLVQNATGSATFLEIFGDGHGVLGYNGSASTISFSATGAVSIGGALSISGSVSATTGSVFTGTTNFGSISASSTISGTAISGTTISGTTLSATAAGSSFVGNVSIGAAAANTQALTCNGGAATPTIALSAGGAIALDASRGNVFTASVTSNATVTISNMASGQTVNLRTTTTGAYTVGFSPTPKWPGGTAGVATSSGTDLWVITYDGTNYYASVLNALA